MALKSTVKIGSKRKASKKKTTFSRAIMRPDAKYVYRPLPIPRTNTGTQKRIEAHRKHISRYITQQDWQRGAAHRRMLKRIRLAVRHKRRIIFGVKERMHISVVRKLLKQHRPHGMHFQIEERASGRIIVTPWTSSDTRKERRALKKLDQFLLDRGLANPAYSDLNSCPISVYEQASSSGRIATSMRDLRELPMHDRLYTFACYTKPDGKRFTVSLRLLKLLALQFERTWKGKKFIATRMLGDAAAIRRVA